MDKFLTISTFAGFVQIISGIIMWRFPTAYGNIHFGFSKESTLHSETYRRRGQRLYTLALLIIGALYVIPGVLLCYKMIKIRAAALAISFICLWLLARIIITKQLGKVV